MKQFHITSENIIQSSSDDCYLSPTDPVHELKATAMMGGLGAQQRLADYRATLKTPVIGSNKGQLQREQGIKPGTTEWFKLWFGKNK